MGLRKNSICTELHRVHLRNWIVHGDPKSSGRRNTMAGESAFWDCALCWLAVLAIETVATNGIKLGDGARLDGLP